MKTSTSELGKVGRPEIIRALFKSDLEFDLAQQLEAEGLPVVYEEMVIPYEVPARHSTYTPDLILPGGIIIEGKGRFGHRGNQKTATEERQKLILVKRQHPELDIRLVFWNPDYKIYKSSKTTYAKWAETHGFPWAAKVIPQSWLDEAKANLLKQGN